MSFETLHCATANAVATVTLNRPEVRNAIDSRMITELTTVAETLDEDDAVRAVLLTGEGAGFCAGADLTADTPGQDPNLSRGENIRQRLERGYNPMVLAWRGLNKPVVVAVNGVAAGGGVGLALVGDIVIAAESARFIQVFCPRLGLAPDMGCTWHLPRLVGDARARALTLLGDPLSAVDAERIGLIWRCVPDAELAAEARAVAVRLAGGPTKAFARTKRLLDNAARRDLEEQLTAEARAQQSLGDSDDFAEGVHAFLDRREPRFTGR